MSEQQQKDLDQLWLNYKLNNDLAAKDALIVHYLSMVKKLVWRMMPRYNNFNEYDDLINCGAIGLIDAVEKFDLSHKVKFETYAVTRIRGEILDYMRDQDWAPSSLRKKINAIADVYSQHENKFGVAPTDQQVAANLGVNINDVRKVLLKNHAFNLLYFEDNNNNGQSMGSVISSDSIKTPEQEVLKQEIAKVLAEVIEELPEKEKLVISLYYYEELMFKEIAEILEVSESRISQIHSRVLLKMRIKLKDIV